LLGGAVLPALLASAVAHAGATATHVLILSIDGLHEADLTDPNTAAFLPNIEALASHGISYTNAQTSQPSDSFPGILAYLTGASPRTTGVFYDDSYSRTLTAPGGIPATPKGTEVQLAENIDKNLNLLSGGGPTSGPGAFGKGAIDPAQLPLSCTGTSCTPVMPWQYNKVNTIFDVAHNAGLHTAFSDKHPGAYTIVAGPTGNAVDDFYSPEINSMTAIDPAQGGKLVDASTNINNLPLVLTTNNFKNTEAYDALKVTAIKNEIDGKNSLGDTSAPVPNLFAMNFQAVSVAQKLLTNSTGTGGIDFVAGHEVVNPALADALETTDAAVGSIVAELKSQGLFNSTDIILTAKHGQDPRIGAATLVSDSAIPNVLTSAGISVAQATQDDVSLIWLADQSQLAAAKAALAAYAAGAGVEVASILDGSQFGAPATDGRTPDLIVKLKPGFIYVGNTSSTVKRAEHGGLNPDDLNVPIILGGGTLPSDLSGDVVSQLVSTQQIAPTVLDLLGLDPNQLIGVQVEGTLALPDTPVGIPEPALFAPLVLGLAAFGVVGRRSPLRGLSR
jgi:hypothetical protein